jgi:hypothetical protein
MNTRFVLFVLVPIAILALSACGRPAADPTTVPTPTLVATRTPDPMTTPEPIDPAKVVQEFWDALNAGDVGTAISFVAEHATCRGSCYFSGKALFQAYLQGVVDSGSTSKITNLQVEDDNVSFFWELYRNEALQETGTDTMQVQNGKIVHWENVHP